MKMLKVLDAKGTVLVTDALNQIILQKLALSQRSITELSREINTPPLKLWRRMQQLLKANLVEVSGAKKIGNLEQKLYRATATRYVPGQFFEFKPNDPNLQAAFAIYVKIQNEMMAILSTFDDIQIDGDPTDFALYANLRAFIQVFEKTNTQANMREIKQILAEYDNGKSSLKS